MLHTPTSQPLFIQHKSAAELLSKEAAAIARMPDDDKRWPAQVLSEIHKQLPFVSKYDVDIEMTRVEPEAGYALGYAILRNKTGRQRAEEQLGKPTNKMRVPVIVADRMLQPFHVFEIGGKVYPLTQDRVESAMMNPAMFDGAADPPGTRSLLDQIYPPFQHRQGYGMMSGDRSTQGVSKLSSAPTTSEDAFRSNLARVKAKGPGYGGAILGGVTGGLVGAIPGTMNHLMNGASPLRALGGAAIGATVGGLGGHLLDRRDHKANLRSAAWTDEMNSPENLDKLNASVNSYAKTRGKELHQLSPEEVQDAIALTLSDPHFRAIHGRHHADPRASTKSASGELGPLREFLRQQELEKQAFTVPLANASKATGKFFSGLAGGLRSASQRIGANIATKVNPLRGVGGSVQQGFQTAHAATQPGTMSTFLERKAFDRAAAAREAAQKLNDSHFVQGQRESARMARNPPVDSTVTAAPPANPPVKGKNLLPYVVGAGGVLGGSYLLNKGTDTISQY